ncbi:MAG: DUF4215 domain-containing protein [Byssovorax sp.]
MKSKLIAGSIVAATLIAGLAAGCTAGAPTGRGEVTDDLVGAQVASLAGSYEGKMGTSPYGFSDELLGVSLAPDGRFFGRISANCDGLWDRVRGRISGSYASLPGGKLALTTDLSALGPLPDSCKATLRARFGGAFTATVSSSEIRLEGMVDEWNAVRYLLHRVDSYCTQTDDCDALALAHEACDGGFTCDVASHRCGYECTPVVAPGTLRIRVPKHLPADGLTEVPIFVDTHDRALEKAAFVISLSRPNAGKLSQTSVRIGPTGFQNGYWAGIAVTSSLLPCDASKDASCLGAATISVALAGQSTSLAEVAVELVAPTEDLPGTACLGGGNIIDADFITGIGLSTIGKVHGTHVLGKGSGHAHLNSSVGGSVGALDVMLNGKNTFGDVELSGPGLALGIYPVTSSAGSSTQYGISVDMDGSGEPSGAKGRARIVELAYLDSSAPLSQGVEIARATVAWEIIALLGTKSVTLRGCAHYDHLAPPYGCGDGVVDAGEQCDDGNDDPTDGCLPSCKLARCGDGLVQAGVEQCDDGNTQGKDGCSATCADEGAPAAWTCDPAYYDEGKNPDAYCDCGCGAPDPDCAPSVPVYGCAPGQTCNASGKCQE